MGKFLIGTIMMVAGLFMSFIPPFIWGPPLAIVGLLTLMAGFAGMSKTAAKTVIAVGKEIRNGSDGPAPAPIVQPGLTLQPAPASAPAAKDYDVAKWQALAEFDPEIKAAADRLAGYGQVAIDRLARAYLALENKAMLDQMVSKIATEEAAAAQQREEERLRYEEQMANDPNRVVETGVAKGLTWQRLASGAFKIQSSDRSNMIDFETWEQVSRYLKTI